MRLAWPFSLLLLSSVVLVVSAVNRAPIAIGAESEPADVHGTVVAETPTSSPLSSATAVAVPEDAVESGPEMALFNLTNADRARRGLPAVRFAPELLLVARTRAAAQDPTSTLNHYDATGQLVFARMISDLGLNYRLIGENLARVGGPEDSLAERAAEALMNSPTHRANILEPSFDSLAIGSVSDANGRIVFAQIFGAASGH